MSTVTDEPKTGPEQEVEEEPQGTSTQPEAQPEEEPQKPEKEPAGPTSYRIFMKGDEDEWTELGIIQAIDPHDARKHAVEKFGLERELHSDRGLTLVAVVPRFWQPKSARIETTSNVVFD